MKVIWFNGNLGNQVFYCKFIEFLRKHYPKETIKYYCNSKCPKIRVAQCFQLTIPERTDSLKVRFVFEVLSKVFGRVRMPLRFIPKWYCPCKLLIPEATYIDNYCQDKRFYENEDSAWLQIRKPQTFSDSYLDFERMILNTHSVSVHVRRGDYLRPGIGFVNLCETDYYDKAFAKAYEIYPDAQFFFFSDDLDFVKKVFRGDNMHYVDCNRGADSYLDILLMSQAKVNIIANSTFSYWGAYMGHEHKTVICPKVWYRFKNADGRLTPDILMDSWIKIDTP